MTNRKNDTEFHEVLKQAAIYVYRGKNAKLPEGYRVIETAENKETGFYADVLSNGQEVIIAYRGTQFFSSQDVKNDANMAIMKNIPAQTTDALRLHDKIKREHPNFQIAVTGHSLGGSIGEVVSAIRGTLAVTFNAYGVRDMFKEGTNLKEDNIINYVNEKDPVTMINGKNHLGEIYAVENIGVFVHNAESMGKLSERQSRTKEEIAQKSDILNKVKNRINSKTNEIKNNIKQKVKKITECVGSYPVSGYTRSDGKEVGPYTRSCGASHGR